MIILTTIRSKHHHDCSQDTKKNSDFFDLNLIIREQNEVIPRVKRRNQEKRQQRLNQTVTVDRLHFFLLADEGTNGLQKHQNKAKKKIKTKGGLLYSRFFSKLINYYFSGIFLMKKKEREIVGYLLYYCYLYLIIYSSPFLKNY